MRKRGYETYQMICSCLVHVDLKVIHDKLIDGSNVTFKLLLSMLNVRKGSLALTSPGCISLQSYIAESICLHCGSAFGDITCLHHNQFCLHLMVTS